MSSPSAAIRYGIVTTAWGAFLLLALSSSQGLWWLPFGVVTTASGIARHLEIARGRRLTGLGSGLVGLTHPLFGRYSNQRPPVGERPDKEIMQR